MGKMTINYGPRGYYHVVVYRAAREERRPSANPYSCADHNVARHGLSDPQPAVDHRRVVMRGKKHALRTDLAIFAYHDPATALKITFAVNENASGYFQGTIMHDALLGNVGRVNLQAADPIQTPSKWFGDQRAPG